MNDRTLLQNSTSVLRHQVKEIQNIERELAERYELMNHEQRLQRIRSRNANKRKRKQPWRDTARALGVTPYN